MIKIVKYVIGVLVLLGLLLLLLFRGKIDAFLLAQKKTLNTKKEVLYLKSSITRSEVLEIILKKGIYSDTNSLIGLMDMKNYQANNVVGGKYIINKKISINKLVNMLRSGNGMSFINITFNNVRNLNQLAGKVSKQIEADSVELIRFFNNPDVQSKYGFNSHTFISLFLPDTYEFKWNTSAEGFVARMADEYKKFWADEDRQEAKRALGFTQSDVTTLASIVKAEQSRIKDEQPIIAGLYINRIRQGIALESDPTLVFANNDFSLKRVYNKHKKIDSPYNTYKYKGLPPGPINIPEKHVIDAVLNYDRNNYIFMCAKPGYSGEHNFTKTYNQHKKNAREYQQWLNQEKIH